MPKRRLGRRFESVSRRAAANLLDGVPGRLEEDDVHLVEEDTGQQTEAGGKDGDDLHRRDELAVRAEVRRDEGDPDDEEDQHAERDELGLREVFGEFPRLEGEEETHGRQHAGVADEEAQRHHGALVAGDDDDLVDVIVSVTARRSVVQPNHADHDLHEREQEHQ